MTEIVKKFYTVFENKEFSIYKEVLADNFTTHSHGQPPKVGYKDAVEDGLIAFLKFCPDLKYEILKTAEEGDTVFVYSNFDGFPGMPAKQSVDIFRLENAKIAEHWYVSQDLTPSNDFKCPLAS